MRLKGVGFVDPWSQIRAAAVTGLSVVKGWLSMHKAPGSIPGTKIMVTFMAKQTYHQKEMTERQKKAKHLFKVARFRIFSLAWWQIHWGDKGGWVSVTESNLDLNCANKNLSHITMLVLCHQEQSC